MNKFTHKIKAVFSDYPQFIAALKSVAATKNIELDVLSPMPLHDVEAILPQKPSGVRWFTFLGGFIGLAIGIGFPIYTVMEWPLITGGKPLITMPAFIIVAFEVLILIGAVFTLVGLLFFAKLPRQNTGDYDPRFSVNAFGILIKTSEAQLNALKSQLKDADEMMVTPVEPVTGEVTS